MLDVFQVYFVDPQFFIFICYISCFLNALWHSVSAQA